MVDERRRESIYRNFTAHHTARSLSSSAQVRRDVPRQDSSYCKTCFAAIAAALVALDLTRREGVIATGVLAAMQAGGSGAAASVNATAAAAAAAELL